MNKKVAGASSSSATKPREQDAPATLVPRLRFPEFQDAGEWEVKALEECLDYQQPTPYLVKDDRYNPTYKTPVLTAGKTFILGYTNEEYGIFIDGLPVIIFDDFTTATQFVDFPFKAKSSAMKILEAKNGANIKFMFEALQNISFEVGAHERHWISTFASMLVPIPSPPEQQRIADCLSSLDALIAAQARKVDALRSHKKGLMQQLFPRDGETQPRLRFPEFQDAGEWEEKNLGNIGLFASGGTPSKDNPEYWNGSIPWVSASSMYEPVIHKADHYVTPKAIGNGTRIAKKGSLLILVRGSMLFNRVPICVAGIDVTFNQDVKSIEIDISINTSFLFYQLSAFQSRFIINETGIGAGKIELEQLKKFAVFIPEQIEQQRIADCLSSLDELISAATQRLATLKTHKQGLMQQLFPNVAGASSSADIHTREQDAPATLKD